MKNHRLYVWPVVAIYPEEDEYLLRFLEAMDRSRMIPRLWEKDWTLWKASPEEVVGRLGWLEAPEKMTRFSPQMKNFAQEVIKNGLEKALLLGMGGSSLSAEVLSQVHGQVSSGLALHVLDSVVPAAVKAMAELCPPARTLFLVSSKSGTTIETQALFHYFWARSLAEIGAEAAGSHFVAITDPGTPLQSISERSHFRRVWLSDPSIGGRFSALSPFGLVPGSVLGMEISALIDSARQMMVLCQEETPGNNPGALLAAFLAAAAAQKKDKLLLWVEPEISRFGDWLEQLIAESTGKEGKGLVPVIGQEELLDLMNLPDVCLVAIGSPDHTSRLRKEIACKLETPAIFLSFSPGKETGAMFFLWEWAIAMASSFLKINPFDQPDVEKTKLRTQQILERIKKTGNLPPLSGGLAGSSVTLFGSLLSTSITHSLKLSLEEAKNSAYLALLAFLAPEKKIQVLLSELRKILIRGLHRPVTICWGPRYLHSTGQLHKGDSGLGFFWQLTADDADDFIIPAFLSEDADWLTFGQLKEAQARADYETLLSLNRKIIKLALGKDVIAGLDELRNMVLTIVNS